MTSAATGARTGALARLPFEHDVSGCLAGGIGEYGLSDAHLAAALARTEPGLAWIRERHAAGDEPLLTLPARGDDIAALRPLAARFQAFDTVVILGTGGSSLGGRTLNALADYGFGPASGPALIFMDNVDPDGFKALDASVDWRRTGLVVISKSGGTVETLAQFLTLAPQIVDCGGEDALRRQAVAISEPGDNPLRRLAAHFGIEVIDHDPDLGGRFAVLSAVGLLPAMIAGLDVAGLRAGARAVLEATLAAVTPRDAPPALGAATIIGLAEERGARVSVLMPYADRLAHFGMWYRQLWAESLGKKGRGTTPVRAMGTVDQHSQLQLYLDGPRDKAFTVLMGAPAGSGARFAEAEVATAGLDYLRGRTMGDVLDAEQRATIDTLRKGARPTRVIRYQRLDETLLGALLMHFMLETILAAHVLGVPAYGQPAVEKGKILAREYLRKAGGA